MSKKTIEANPETLHGVARIAGVRMPVWALLHDLADGYSIEQIAERRHIKESQVIDAIQFAAAVLQQRAEPDFLREWATPEEDEAWADL